MIDYSETVKAILEKADVADVISKYIDIKPKGNDFMAVCPFHEDTHPSLSISTSRQIFKCFACGTGGNVITFVREYEKLSFPDAVISLAKHCSIALPEQSKNYRSYNTTKNKTNQQLTLEQSILNSLLQACKWFQQQLTNNAEILDYAKKRQITAELIQKFAIGYSPQNINASLLSQTNTDSLVKAGIIYTNNHKNRFANRLMFPIRDIKGQVLGFGGRAMATAQVPKYLNSPETPVFHKGQILYGMYEMHQHTRNHDFICVVEGYMDVVALHAVGFYNVVASMGIAMSEQHWKLLFRYSPEVVLCFDGDAAGLKATKQAVEIGLQHMRNNRNIKITLLPTGYDPDDLAAEKCDIKEELYDKSIAVSEYLFYNYLAVADYKLPEDKARLITKIAPLIASMPAGIVQDMFIVKLEAITNKNFILGTNETNGKPVLQLQPTKANSQTNTNYNNNNYNNNNYNKNYNNQKNATHANNEQQDQSIKAVAEPLNDLAFFLLHHVHLALKISTAQASTIKAVHKPVSLLIDKLIQLANTNSQPKPPAFLLGALQQEPELSKYAEKLLLAYYPMTSKIKLKEEEFEQKLQEVISNIKQQKRQPKMQQINKQIKKNP